MELTTTEDKKLSFIRALVHGDSGIGKTTSLTTLPADRTIILAAERGLLPLRRQKFPVLRIECWNDLRQAMAALNHPEAVENEAIRNAAANAKTVACDSLTEFSMLCMRHIVEVDRRKLVSERTKEKTDKPAGIYEDQMTQEDWGLYRTRMANLTSALCHLPYHIVVTALTAWTENKKSGEVMKTPALSGKFAFEVAAHFDLVLHMEAATDSEGNAARVWRTANDGQVIAKDASGVLDAIEAPNWTSIFTKILGNGKGKQ